MSTPNPIDHLSYYFHRPRLFDKQGLVITTTAGAGENAVAKYLQSILAQWGIGGVQKLGFKIQTVPFALNEKQQKLLDKAVQKFYHAVKNKALKSPDVKSLVIHNSFRGMSAVEVPVSQCDKAYWEKTGLGTKVYPRKVNMIKALLGTAVYRIMKKILRKNHKIEME